MRLQWRDKEIESEFSDEEAALKIEEEGTDNQFAMKMANRVSQNRSLSESQRYWLHNLAMQVSSKQVANPVLPNVSTVYDLLEGAKNGGLKYPKITIPILTDENEVVCNFVFGLAGSRSKYEGKLTIKKNWDESWMAVNKEGEVFRRKDVSDEDISMLQTLFEKFVETCVHSGLVTGNCVFCNKTLSDARSKNKGYGPVCAKHYQLDW